MKNMQLKLGLVALTLCLAFGAQAKEGRRSRHTTTTTESSDTREINADSGMRWGAGFSSYGSGTVGGAGFAPALDVWLDLPGKHSVQFLAGIQSSSPFTFGVGGVYRYDVLGDHAVGAHLGLGFNLGTTAGAVNAIAGGAASSTFFLNIFPVAGFHFDLGGMLSNIRLSFDGGPVFAVTPNFQFSLGPNSVILGGAINYFL
jgi:hypothetical protein